MAQEIGESREKWGWDVWRKAEDFASKVESDVKPFYIVYACKEDKLATQKLGLPAFKQAFMAYFSKPPAMLGILVWYVDKAKGMFEFKPELSAALDVPLDPNLLSDKASDASEGIMDQGRKLKALLS